MQSCTFGRLPPVNLTACVSLLCSFSGAELYSFPGQSFVPMKEHPFCQSAVGAQWAFSSIYSLKSRILRGGFPWGWSTVGHLRPGQWCMTVVDSIACLLTKVFNFLQVSLKEWLAFLKGNFCLFACLFVCPLFFTKSEKVKWYRKGGLQVLPSEVLHQPCILTIPTEVRETGTWVPEHRFPGDPRAIRGAFCFLLLMGRNFPLAYRAL